MQLKQSNFRIDSSGWKMLENGIKVNSQNDVFELLNGEQLFKWDAAMRETKKAGQQIPTCSEVKKFIKSINDIPNPGFNGAIIYSDDHIHFGAFGFYWTRGASKWLPYQAWLFKCFNNEDGVITDREFKDLAVSVCCNI